MDAAREYLEAKLPAEDENLRLSDMCCQCHDESVDSPSKIDTSCESIEEAELSVAKEAIRTQLKTMYGPAAIAAQQEMSRPGNVTPVHAKRTTAPISVSRPANATPVGRRFQSPEPRGVMTTMAPMVAPSRASSVRMPILGAGRPTTPSRSRDQQNATGYQTPAPKLEPVAVLTTQQASLTARPTMRNPALSPSMRPTTLATRPSMAVRARRVSKVGVSVTTRMLYDKSAEVPQSAAHRSPVVSSTTRVSRISRSSSPVIVSRRTGPVTVLQKTSTAKAPSPGPGPARRISGATASPVPSEASIVTRRVTAVRQVSTASTSARRALSPPTLPFATLIPVSTPTLPAPLLLKVDETDRVFTLGSGYASPLPGGTRGSHARGATNIVAEAVPAKVESLAAAAGAATGRTASYGGA